MKPTLLIEIGPNVEPHAKLFGDPFAVARWIEERPDEVEAQVAAAVAAALTRSARFMRGTNG